MPRSTSTISAFLAALEHVAVRRPVTIDGLAGDGTTDDTAALQAAFSKGGDILLPPSRMRITTSLIINQSNTRVFGSGRSSVLLIKNENTRAITLSGERLSGVHLAGFEIQSHASTALSSAGLIHCDGTAIEGLTLEDITFDAPRHGMNAAFFKSRPKAEVNGLTVRGCKVLGTGRMGFEVIQHENREGIYGREISFIDNSIKNTGALGHGMAISVSGGLGSVTAARNFLEENSYCGIELAGPLDAVVVSENVFSGATGDLIKASNVGPLSHLSLSNNVSRRGTRGKVQLAQCHGAIIEGNNLDCSQLELFADNCTVIGNHIYASSTVALLLNNTSATKVFLNTLSTAQADNNWAVLRAYGSRAAGNVARDNSLIKGRGGVYFDQVDGASNNTFIDSILH